MHIYVTIVRIVHFCSNIKVCHVEIYLQLRYICTAELQICCVQWQT